ncbi:hypothetical protein JCGZ_06662 [Jatropha curcas]|uniref:RRM domain-containing protein n=2 Tax=Jatropha curcas TaxID=180498 RepID=A0A067LCE0_JATCU|nr:hypothetical protein JCGZ_06662 [Jatropha curcas]
MLSSNKSICDNIPLFHSFTKTKLTLTFFHENRLVILPAVSKIVNQVCERAFQDIFVQAEKLKSVVVSTFSDGKKKVFDSYGGNLIYGPYNHQLGNLGFSNNYRSQGNYDNIEIQNQKQILNDEIADLLSHIHISSTNDEEKDNSSVPADERTIFLTFSKGYPISEAELGDFFMRKYGDCIEAIHMQEVLGEDQPLYARLVVYSPTIIHVVLEGKNKAKFSINGKHVWARKYVRKNPRSSLSPPQPASPTSPPQSMNC